MLEKFKKDWQEFKDAEPGHRFQERYECHQRECEGKANRGKILNIGAGLIIAIIGLILIPAPGPGAIILGIGLALIGSEFLPLARFLDKAEVRLRPLAEWPKKMWGRAPLALKGLMSFLALACFASVAYGGYHFFFNDPRGLERQMTLKNYVAQKFSKSSSDSAPPQANP